MALSDRERKCIEALCTYLGSQRGDTWRITDDSLDARHPNEPTPEAIISNGTDTVAPEVKRLMGTDEDTQFRKNLESLWRSLTPSRPGRYCLFVPFAWTLPWDRTFVRRIGVEIERLCWELVPGPKAYVRVPRKARLSKVISEGGLVRCWHDTDPVPGLSALVRGVYFLDDQRPRHSFHTDEMRDQFRQKLLAGIASIDSGEEEVWVEWEEEWELTFSESDTPRLYIVGFVRGFWAEPAAREAVRLRIGDANKKFHRRWADRHAVILDNEFIFAGLEEPCRAFGTLDPEEYGGIDDVYLYDNGVINSMFSRS